LFLPEPILTLAPSMLDFQLRSLETVT